MLPPRPKHTRIEQTRLDNILVALVNNSGDPGDFREVLKEGANPDKPSGPLQATPIGRVILTTSHKRLDTVKALLGAAADPNIGDANGNRPLHSLGVSSNGGNEDIAKLLIAHKADVNAPNNDGDTPLHVSVRHWLNSNAPWAVLLLLQSGADMNRQNARGETPLQIAINHRKTPDAKERVREMFVRYASLHRESPEAQKDVAAENLRKLREKRRPGLKL